MKLTVKPLTPQRWSDFESVFRAPGCSVARGCWCMYYRRSGAVGKPPRGLTRAEANRREFKKLIDRGEFTGLIGYLGKQPVGWVSFGPRAVYRKLARSPVMKPLDEQPVWSIVCFVVPSQFRGQGVARELLRGAIAFARKKGVKVLEAYPVDKPARSHDDFMWFGAKSMYDAAGFEEVARRRPTRPIVRMQPAR